MKIYFAYRTAYKSNLRHIKEFESNSIYDWFIENWETLNSDKYSDLLGIDVYGFPIDIKTEEVKEKKQSLFSKLFEKKGHKGNKDESKPKKPENFQNLLELLEEGLYINEITGDENCIKVATDDDEIELGWFIFTEEYKKQNKEKTEIWFNDILPTSFGINGIKINEDIPTLNVKGKNEGYTYFLSSPIYDGSNLEDMTVIKIEGVRLNNLLDFLVNNEINEIEDVLYSINELNYIKHIENQLKSNNLKKVLETFANYPITELEDIEIQEKSLSEIKEMELSNLPEKSKIIVNEHSAEISVNSIEIFYNYFLFIDDLWVEENERLAKSILYFGENWDI
ncbi:MAG: hypothetical protein N4A45_08755 [Flavobacteriales bacterium]|jgi:hypothetical protein|nr:hypothetical protein [Flavobacteriales bacterium]